MPERGASQFLDRSWCLDRRQTFVYYALPESVDSAECRLLLSLRSWFRCSVYDVVYLFGALIERYRNLSGVDIGLPLAFMSPRSSECGCKASAANQGSTSPTPQRADASRSRWIAWLGSGADQQQGGRLDVPELRSIVENQLTADYRVPVPVVFPEFLPQLAYGSVAHRLSAFDWGSGAGAVGVCACADPSPSHPREALSTVGDRNG